MFVKIHQREKLSLIQDDLDSVFDFNPEKKKAYHLVRGRRNQKRLILLRKQEKLQRI